MKITIEISGNEMQHLFGVRKINSETLPAAETTLSEKLGLDCKIESFDNGSGCVLDYRSKLVFKAKTPCTPTTES